MGKVPPQAIEAEEYLLGALLQDSHSLSMCLETSLGVDDFYYEKHSYIFKAILELYNENEPVDVITVKEKIRSMGKYELLGDDHYLFELVEKVASSANVGFHSKLIKEKAQLRGLIAYSSEIITQAQDPTITPDTVIQNAERNILALAEERVKGGLVPIGSLLQETLQMIDKVSSDDITGVPSGFIELDKMTSGLQPTDMIVLAGRPGMGKTAFALSLMSNSAMDYNKSVAFFSLEMGAEQLVQRVLCQRAMINMHSLKSGKLRKEDLMKIPLIAQTISDTPIFIDDNPGLSILELKSKCRILTKKHPLDMIIIDYLQLMDIGGAESHQLGIAQISRGLKELAKELKVPIIALSQLSRKVEDRGGDGRPQLSDIRDSGAIEQDADMVWFVNRPGYRKEDADPNESELIIAKHRNGPQGIIPLTFIGEHTGFYNYSPREGQGEYEGDYE